MRFKIRGVEKKLALLNTLNEDLIVDRILEQYIIVKTLEIKKKRKKKTGDCLEEYSRSRSLVQKDLEKKNPVIINNETMRLKNIIL